MTHAYLSCVTLSLKMHDSPSNRFATSLSSRAGRSPGSELAHMSVFGSKADMCNAKEHIRFAPKADILFPTHALLNASLQRVS